MMASALPLLGILVAIAVLGLTGNLFSPSPLVIGVQIAAVALNIWARRSFPKGDFRVGAAPGGASVIRRGPYRFIRHPMYTAVVIFVWAAVISHWSVWTVAIGTVVTAIGVTRVVVEERLLRERYPDYHTYAQSTKALVPYVF